VVEQLAREEHPFAGLLILVNDLATLDHDQRANLHRVVAWAFGRTLAESVLQSRVFLPPEPQTPTAASRLSSGPERADPEGAGVRSR
jgi:hypothetical protein